MALLTGIGMGDDVPKFPPHPDFGGWRGSRSACQGWAVSHWLGRTDGCSALGRQSRCTDLGRHLGTNNCLCQGPPGEHNKGDGEKEEEEGDAFILLGYPSSSPKGWFKGSIIGMSRGKGGQAHNTSPAFPRDGANPWSSRLPVWRLQTPKKERGAPDKWVKLEGPQRKESKWRFISEGTNITKA